MKALPSVCIWGWGSQVPHVLFRSYCCFTPGKTRGSPLEGDECTPVLKGLRTWLKASWRSRAALPASPTWHAFVSSKSWIFVRSSVASTDFIHVPRAFLDPVFHIVLGPSPQPLALTIVVLPTAFLQTHFSAFPAVLLRAWAPSLLPSLLVLAGARGEVAQSPARRFPHPSVTPSPWQPLPAVGPGPGLGLWARPGDSA